MNRAKQKMLLTGKKPRPARHKETRTEVVWGHGLLWNMEHDVILAQMYTAQIRFQQEIMDDILSSYGLPANLIKR